MSLSTKILIFLFAVVVVGMGGLILWKQFEVSQRQDAIEKSIVAQKEIADNILRAQAQYATKQDVENFAKQANVDIEAIKKDLETLNATLTGVNKVVVVSTPQNSSGVASTNTTPRVDPPKPNDPAPIPQNDPYGYLKNTQKLTLNENFQNTPVPIGEVGFSAWKDKPWDVSINERKYNVVNVLGTDESGRHYVYNKFSIDSAGKTYDAKISQSTYVEEYPEAKFSFWNPRLFLGADGGVGISQAPVRGEFTPNVGVGIMSYGKTKDQPDWSFIQVGVGYGVVSQRPQATISPVQFNVGKYVPLMKNTYVGPNLQVGTDANVGVGAGVRVGL